VALASNASIGGDGLALLAVLLANDHGHFRTLVDGAALPKLTRLLNR